MDMSLYVGVYIKVPMKTEKVTVPVNWYCTGNKDHRVKADHKFCPHCGQEVIVETKLASRAIDITPHHGKFETDEFYSPESLHHASGGYNIWLVDRIDSEVVLTHGTDEFVYSITPTKINTAIATFNSKHGKLVERLKEEFGNGVIVEFGAISYWS